MGEIFKLGLSPIKVPMLEQLLQYYDDTTNRDLLLLGFKQGFRLGYTGPRKPQFAEPLTSVKQNPLIAQRKIQKEIEAGRVAGPFPKPPIPNLKCSPIGIVPKHDPGEYRLIHHLSYPCGRSVNDGIPEEHCTVTYTSFDEAVAMVAKTGVGCQMAKTDIKSAFRLLPIYPGDFDLLGFFFDGKYFFDKMLPMGASVSCALFEKFAMFLECTVKRVTGCPDVVHYLDDWLFVGEADSNQCQMMLEKFTDICEQLGVPLAKEKTVAPTQKITFLGLELDSVKQQVRIPGDKLAKLRKQLNYMLKEKVASLKQVQSLIGSLNFLCKAVAPGRTFMRRLIDLTVNVTNPIEQIRIGRGALEDMVTWMKFLDQFNGVSLFLQHEWDDNADIELYTDAAASIGFGAYFQGSWTQGKWNFSRDERPSIAYLELYPIYIAIILWGHRMSNKRIYFWSDNQTVVTCINKKTSKCPMIMGLLRPIVLKCLMNNILFKAKYVPGEINQIADSLSRFQNQRFRELAPEAEAVMTPLP